MAVLNVGFRGRLCGNQKLGLLLAVCALTALVCAYRLSPPANTVNPISWMKSPTPRQKTLVQTDVMKSSGQLQSPTSPAPPEHAQCHDVMGAMTQGRWERRPMTSSDVQRMKVFHKHVREVEHGMPPGLQRQDGLCGNISFHDKGGPHPWWFRAVCDAEGDKPCCYHHRCVNRSPQECACADCYDMRNPVHGEFAKWRPDDRRCQVQEMSVEQICRLLDKATLYFIGDSMVRHVYTAMVMMVRGDNVNGAFRRDIPQTLKSNCSGIYMFTEKDCRHWVDHNVQVCPGQTTHLRLIDQAYNSNIQGNVSPLYNKPRSLAVMGMGFHGKLNAGATYKTVMKPLLDYKKAKHLRWPQLVWATTHHWGVLKNPNIPGQSAHNVSRFNEGMKGYLRPFGPDQVAVFDAFNMTGSGVESFDGVHYGYGVNKVKAQILLNFIQELQSKNRW